MEKITQTVKNIKNMNKKRKINKNILNERKMIDELKLKLDLFIKYYH